jgi:putative oxidoreductase
MNLHRTKGYETWAPVVGRVFLGVLFLFGATGKIPGTEMFSMSIAWAGGFGVPFPEIAVTLAFIIEVLGGLMLIFGWNARLAAFALALFTIIITPIFHSNFGDVTEFTMFMKNLAIVGGLFYVSVYGAQKAAIAKCPLPHGS